jgi:hypothetical protein
MGMFDTIRVKFPLPAELQGESFQTKSLYCKLATFEIGEDGGLYKTSRVEPIPEDERAKMEPLEWLGEPPFLRTVECRELVEDFHGDILFGYDPTYRARFTDGVCQWIKEAE